MTGLRPPVKLPADMPEKLLRRPAVVLVVIMVPIFLAMIVSSRSKSDPVAAREELGKEETPGISSGAATPGIAESWPVSSAMERKPYSPTLEEGSPPLDSGSGSRPVVQLDSSDSQYVSFVADLCEIERSVIEDAIQEPEVLEAFRKTAGDAFSRHVDFNAQLLTATSAEVDRRLKAGDYLDETNLRQGDDRRHGKYAFIARTVFPDPTDGAHRTVLMVIGRGADPTIDKLLDDRAQSSREDAGLLKFWLKSLEK